MVYYKGLFKIYPVEILTSECFPDLSYDTPHFRYKYLIRFSNGKMKYVSSKRLIFTD